jgi:fibronectin-binding autotransporter adhesin
MPKNRALRAIDLRPGGSSSGSAVAVSGGGGGTTTVTDHGALTGLADDDHTQYHNDARGDLRYVQATRNLIAGAGLTGGGTLAADRTFAVGAGLGITVNADDVALASSVAGAGLTYSSGVLAVGAGDGLTAAADSIAVGVSGLGLGVGADAVTLTSSSNPGAAAAILASDASGILTLPQYIATTKVRTPLLDATGNLTLDPTPGSAAQVLPGGTYLKDLGDYNRKWRTLFAAELYVETLVAQDVLATIGGRVIVAPTTTLIASVNSTQTTIDVKHNNLDNAYLYLASAPGGVAQFEWMKVSGTYTTITGGYRYTVARSVEQIGYANGWQEGDAVVNMGSAAGHGWLELTSTQTVRNHLGPTLAIYTRTGTAAWNTVEPVVSLGNLRSFVDYSADKFGLAIGNDLEATPTTGFSGLTADVTNGLRLFNTPIVMYSGATPVGSWASNGQLDIGFSGVATVADRDFTVHADGYVRVGRTGANKPNLLYDSSGLALRMNTTEVIKFGSDGTSSFTGDMTVGPGALYFGGGVGRLNASGIAITATTGALSALNSYGFLSGGNFYGGLMGRVVSPVNGLHLYADSTGNLSPRIEINAAGTATYDGSISLRADGSVTTALSLDSATGEASLGGSTLQLSGATTVTGTMGVTGTLTLTNANPALVVGSSNMSTGDAQISVGANRTGNGNAYIDLKGDTTYGYAVRLIRGNTGANATTSLIHRGTGDFSITAEQAGALLLKTTNTTRLTIASGGDVTVAGAFSAASLSGVLIPTAGTAPASVTDASGVLGEVRWDTSWLYLKVASSGNRWRRAQLNTW